MPLAWGAKVSAEFRDKVIAVGQSVGVDPSWLMACMAFESGETFSPSVRNAAGSGATGLIQFMSHTAIALGTTTQALAAMTAERQLDYVAAYFRPYRGKLNNLGDVYMAILWPAGIGKADDFVLFDKANPALLLYVQNRGLDYDGDGHVTRAEACARVVAKLAKGLQATNASPVSAASVPAKKPLPVLGPVIVTGAAAPIAVAVAHSPQYWPILLAIAGAIAVTVTVYAFFLSTKDHKGHPMTVSPEFQADLDAIAAAVTTIAAHVAGDSGNAALQAQLDAANAALATANADAATAAQDKADTLAALNDQVAALESQVAALSAPPAPAP